MPNPEFGWAYEAIRMKWIEGETTILVENAEREGYDPATRSWPAFLQKKVSGIWKWMNTIETGGYWEHYDHNDERTIQYHGFLQKCYCDDAQFVFYGTDDLCGFCFNQQRARRMMHSTIGNPIYYDSSINIFFFLKQMAKRLFVTSEVKNNEQRIYSR